MTLIYIAIENVGKKSRLNDLLKIKLQRILVHFKFLIIINWLNEFNSLDSLYLKQKLYFYRNICL